MKVEGASVDAIDEFADVVVDACIDKQRVWRLLVLAGLVDPLQHLHQSHLGAHSELESQHFYGKSCRYGHAKHLGICITGVC